MKRLFVLLMCLPLIAGLPIAAWPLLPDTGQTKCYDDQDSYEITCPQPNEPFFGQDANYNINPPHIPSLMLKAMSCRMVLLSGLWCEIM
jgi:hypothetical protein